MEKTIKWIYGNSLTLALPLKKVTVTSGGKIISDYYPPADSEISVYLRGAKTFIYPYILEGNTIIIADDGSLIRGCYTAEVIILEPEGLRLRFQWPEVLTVVDNTKEALPEFYNVPDYAEGITLDAGVFYFAKGDKGDTGPQGPKGDSIPGPQGPQGPQGPAGTTDYNELTNKPNLANVATSGSYNDLSDKPVIPDFSSKADKVQNPTVGNFASLDSNGNYIDSGHKHSDYLTSHQDLSNYVQKSNTAGLLKNDGTVDTNTYLTQHQDISGKQDKVTVEAASGATLTVVVDKYYTLSNVGTLAITLPTCTGTKIQSVVFYISTGSTPAVTFSSTHTILYSDGFEIAADSIYEVNALWNGTAWCLALIKLIESV